MSTTFGESDYRRAGVERVRESAVLLREGSLAGCVYLAGRAVEGMLRALIWRADPDFGAGRRSLETGHDLRELLELVRKLKVFTNYDRGEEVAISVQRVGRLWFNSMRFMHAARLKTYWWRLGEVGGKRTLKAAAADFHQACSTIVKRCEALCER